VIQESAGATQLPQRGNTIHFVALFCVCGIP
jgi:hypothetical protein